MEILVRKKGDGEWEKVTESRFQDEAALQDVLYRSPEIIPIEKLGEGLSKPKVFIKEAGLPGSGYTDLIGIDENGGITIIECKLATNTDIRRKVIGQVLEYAAYLWQMSYDQFDSVCCKAERWKDKNLAIAMRDAVEKADEPWLEDKFRDNLTSTLEKGVFRLIIAVDALNDELKRIIEFLNSRGQGSPQIHALEMKQFETPELQMLIPELFGQPIMVVEGMMNEELFRSKSSSICSELYDRLKGLAEREEFKASDFTKRGFAFRYHKTNLFVLFPNYLMMWIGQGWSGDVLGKEVAEEFWPTLFQIPELEKKKDKKNPEVVVNDDTWTQKHVTTFVSALELLGSRLGKP